MILIAIILFLGVPIGISYLIYSQIKKSGIDKRYRLLSFLPILIVGYFVYDAIYPDSEFYKTDFKEVTEIEFPKNGEIVFKTASFPDNFGDYTSSFLVELDKVNLKKIEENLIKIGFEKKESKMNTDELEYIENKKGNKKYISIYTKETESDKLYSVGFLDDNKSVIITRVSW
ncbi:MAG: hypothetical protein RL705_504 [Bacteroidota bacterium]|jgi:hypothetical protein